MTEHTKEPWSVAGIADEMIVAKVSELAHAHIATIHHNENDSRRIVVCVNFCAGISTENLEGNEKLLWLAEQYNEVKSLRSHAEAQVRHFQERLAVFQAQLSKAKTLIHDLRTPVETGLHNAKVMNCPLGVEKREDELRRIEEILNWKEAD
ncbi:hypothetical protein [Aeromonas dhakensis]|uniref:Uncharacterized protein n=1 Tax=Aeromonas dhakensis TaxID=196024 RepID=K1K9L5_9GAMM|nr:hypothetical protein [Aeromonas dhakensis]EKB28354.1 hypothetical protein HMPREF1171_01588 [Aeromonas dhakensis]